MAFLGLAPTPFPQPHTNLKDQVRVVFSKTASFSRIFLASSGLIFVFFIHSAFETLFVVVGIVIVVVGSQ